MFLQKELFEGEGDRAPASRPGTAWSSAGARPSTAASSPGGVGDDGDEVATPGSVVNMRAKMMQQRERLLAKQRSAGAGAGTMVMANKGLPNPEVPTPSSPTAPGKKPPGVPGASPLLSGMGTASLLSGASLASMDSLMTDAADDSGAGAVLPAPPPPPATKEEEEARRKQLQQELRERGLAAEFDPAGPGEPKSTFDIATVLPSDMRAFLHAPVPKHAGTLQCRVVRDRSGIASKLHPKYTMESDSGVFLMSAQKQVKNKTSNYAICMSKTLGGKDSDNFIGKLRSDFLGIEWVAYGPGLNPQKADPKMPQDVLMQQVREELLVVQYTASKWGATAKGPRKMTVVIPRVQPHGERIVCRTLNAGTEGLVALQKQGGTASQMIELYNNKPPKWNDQIGAYVLNFNKRVTEASVKNFQLISATDPETVYLQFGRVGKEVFNLDFRFPISPFQAFTMCLSSFDYKLGCE